MTISIQQASALTLIRMLGNLDAWLARAQAHAHARRFDSAGYLTLRLAPDMLPFASQVRIAADIARLTMARLSDAEFPRCADDEATLAALGGRLRNSVAFVQAVAPERLEGSATREIIHPQRGEALHFTGETFLQRWAMPNFYFHATTAYALLRQAGVELGKADYLGEA